MARTRKHSGATTPEGRLIASRIQDARRRNIKTRDIAKAYNINERTVRKIISGETPGTRIYEERTKTSGVRSSPNVFTVDIEIDEGETRSKNVILPDYTNAKGQKVAPTAFDIFRYPNLDAVAEAEARLMQQRYGMSGEFQPYVTGLRPVARYKKIPFVVRGVERR